MLPVICSELCMPLPLPADAPEGNHARLLQFNLAGSLFQIPWSPLAAILAARHSSHEVLNFSVFLAKWGYVQCHFRAGPTSEAALDVQSGARIDSQPEDKT